MDSRILKRRPHWLLSITTLCLVTALVSGCTIEKTSSQASSDSGKTKVAFVTNGIASFWTIAEAGCRNAAKDNDCECIVRMPTDQAAGQKRILEELINMKVAGIAVTPINPDNQKDIINKAAAETNLITHDSDAPETDRLLYIGMSNYDAGRMCGKLVKEAMPEGGEVIIFVGRLGQLNADLRRQGVIDELLDRDHNPDRQYDPASDVLKGDKYTILDTRTDNFDFAKAKSNAEDAIVKYGNLGCMVGLFAYNPPNMLEAIRGADKLGEIKVVGFDEDDRTLQAIQEGNCYGTVVQNPYMYGYKSVEILAALARGDRSVIPESKFIDIPARSIRKDNVDEFWAELKELTGESTQ
ncbi:sugar-binding protein [Stieleria varia]|uniref:D-ribose-binding periplasmic protein n=1 Tax=Stieleria varia TaxID=2528005 RepID=A0A5C6ANV9_9BACT|nr:sugar-binding protein [Stieleria varia]TWU01198.1 D-ribose-binding periplasmic protein precursor [Stieleria varia]